MVEFVALPRHGRAWQETENISEFAVRIEADRKGDEVLWFRLQETEPASSRPIEREPRELFQNLPAHWAVQVMSVRIVVFAVVWMWTEAAAEDAADVVYVVISIRGSRLSVP